jgi:hypothetical protein
MSKIFSDNRSDGEFNSDQELDSENEDREDEPNNNSSDKASCLNDTT